MLAALLRQKAKLAASEPKKVDTREDNVKANTQGKNTKNLKAATKLGAQKPLSKGIYLRYTMSNVYVSS